MLKGDSQGESVLECATFLLSLISSSSLFLQVMALCIRHRDPSWHCASATGIHPGAQPLLTSLHLRLFHQQVMLASLPHCKHPQLAQFPSSGLLITPFPTILQLTPVCESLYSRLSCLDPYASFRYLSIYLIMCSTYVTQYSVKMVYPL